MTFTDGKDVKAKVMGVDEDKDLAVLIVDPAKLGTEVRILTCKAVPCHLTLNNQCHENDLQNTVDRVFLERRNDNKHDSFVPRRLICELDSLQDAQ